MNVQSGISSVFKIKEDGLAGRLAGLAIWAVLGFAAAGTGLFGQAAPFGTACVAACPRRDALAAAAGAVLGYTFAKEPEGNLRCVAAVLAALMLKLVFERMKDSTIFASLTAGASAGAVGAAFAAAGGASGYGAALAASECVLAGGAAYFFFRARDALRKGLEQGAVPDGDKASLIVTAAIACAALTGLAWGRISAGRIAAGCVVLICARYGRESGGSVAGVATGAAVGLAGSGMGQLVGIYGLSGLLAGVFAVFGKAGCAGAYLLMQLIGVFLESSGYPDFSPFYEGLIAAGLFLLLPQKALKAVSLFAMGAQREADGATVKSLLLRRVEDASRSLEDIAEATKTVSKALSKDPGADVSMAYSRAAEKICRGCSKSGACWGKQYSETWEAFSALTPVLKSGEGISGGSWPEDFAARCPRVEQLSGAVGRSWDYQVARRTLGHRVSRVREVVADQFQGLSEMLADLGGELQEVTKVDRKLTAEVKSWFAAKALSPCSVICWTDGAGRLTVEAQLPQSKAARLDEKFIDELSELCRCDMALPVLTQREDGVRAVIAERPEKTVEFGIAEIAAGGEKHCGDSAACFIDQRGTAHMLLSDGMGSGNAAALDSSMTVGLLTKMINAGFRFGAALKLVNSALLVKSGEESVATADAAAIDLFTGRAVFCKAGAAPAFVLKNGRVSKIEAVSLPAGILGGPEYVENSLSLGGGDVVMLVSDGVTASGEEWLFSELRSVAGKGAQEMAESIAATAKERRADGHEDDITVVVGKVE